MPSSITEVTAEEQTYKTYKNKHVNNKIGHTPANVHSYFDNLIIAD